MGDEIVGAVWRKEKDAIVETQIAVFGTAPPPRLLIAHGYLVIGESVKFTVDLAHAPCHVLEGLSLKSPVLGRRALVYGLFPMLFARDANGLDDPLELFLEEDFRSFDTHPQWFGQDKRPVAMHNKPH